MFVYQKAKWFLKNWPNISWRIGHISYSARLGCPCMAAHRRSSSPGTHVSGPTTSGKFFDCWFERSWKVCLIAIDWEIFHLTAWSIFCTLVLLVHELQGEKTALGSKLPHILAQRLPQGALESLKIIFILYNFRGNYKCDLYKCTTCVVVILEFLGGECQTLSVTFTLRTSLKDVWGHSNRTSGDIPTGCPAMFYFCILTWYLCPLCIYMNSE